MKIFEQTKRRDLFFAAVAICFLLPLKASAIFERGGNTGVGARAMGMGGAFVAVADDPSAAYWNPAGLTQLEVPMLLMSYGSLFDGKTQSLYGSFEFPLPQDIHLGLSVNESIFAGTGGDQQGEYQGSIAIPLQFVPGKKLSVGFNFRYLNAGLGSVLGIDQGIGVDLGFLYRQNLDSQMELNAGLVLDDLSTTTRFGNGVEEDLPTLITPGLALKFDKNTLLSIDFPWTLPADSNQNSDVEFHGGMEHWFFDGQLGLRVGYLGLEGQPGEFTMGAGYRAYQWFVNYAYVSNSNDLGNSHRIEGGWLFDVMNPNFKPDPSPTVTANFVSDGKIYFKWSIPEGSRADGYFVYIRADGESGFHKAKQEALKTDYCLLRGAVNGTRYHLYVTAVVDGKEKFKSNEFTATPRPMSKDALRFYDLGVGFFNQNNLPEALYAARKAEALDPDDYDVRDLLRKLDTTHQQGLVPQTGVSTP